RLGFPVAGIFDVNEAAARERAAEFKIGRVFTTLADATSVSRFVFDICVPPQHVAAIIATLPPGSAVLIQKPLGRDLEEARSIRDICRQRSLVAAVNFQ